MFTRRALAALILTLATARAAAAQPIVYAVVNPPDVLASFGLYRLSPPARLYSIDLATGASTSITLPGTVCFAAAHPDGTRIYAACTTAAGGVVSAIDPVSLTILATAALR